MALLMAGINVGEMRRVDCGMGKFAECATYPALRSRCRKPERMLNKQEIDELIVDVNDLANRIKSIDNLITAIPEADIRDSYQRDLLLMIDSYKRLCNVLQLELKRYTKYEVDNSMPRTFLYHRILKGLKA